MDDNELNRKLAEIKTAIDEKSCGGGGGSLAATFLLIIYVLNGCNFN